MSCPFITGNTGSTHPIQEDNTNRRGPKEAGRISVGLAPAESQLAGYQQLPLSATDFRRARPYNNKIPVMKVSQSSGLPFF